MSEKQEETRPVAPLVPGAETPGRPLVELTHVEKHFGDLHVLKDINLTVNKGEVLVIVGPSGSGKSTMCRTINRLETIDSGDIRIDGKALPQEGRELANLRAEVGMVFQSFNLFANKTILENVTLAPIKVRHMDKKEAERLAMDLLARVGVDSQANKMPSQLSGGQQQRVAIARSLLLRPALLLLDEPFSALDAKIRQQMREELKKIQQDLGITVIFVTHDQEEAMAISHRIVVMNKGVFEQIGTPTEIYDNPSSKYVASFIGEMNFIEINRRLIAVRPENLTVTADGAGDFSGIVRTVMVLGHYVVLHVQCGETVVKCFVDRSISERLHASDRVGLQLGRHLVY